MSSPLWFYHKSSTGQKCWLHAPNINCIESIFLPVSRFPNPAWPQIL